MVFLRTQAQPNRLRKQKTLRNRESSTLEVHCETMIIEQFYWHFYNLLIFRNFKLVQSWMPRIVYAEITLPSTYHLRRGHNGDDCFSPAHLKCEIDSFSSSWDRNIYRKDLFCALLGAFCQSRHMTEAEAKKCRWSLRHLSLPYIFNAFFVWKPTPLNNTLLRNAICFAAESNVIRFGEKVGNWKTWKHSLAQ